MLADVSMLTVAVFEDLELSIVFVSVDKIVMLSAIGDIDIEEAIAITGAIETLFVIAM